MDAGIIRWFVLVVGERSMRQQWRQGGHLLLRVVDRSPFVSPGCVNAQSLNISTTCTYHVFPRCSFIDSESTLDDEVDSESMLPNESWNNIGKANTHE
jgi:hypothetical protein